MERRRLRVHRQQLTEKAAAIRLRRSLAVPPLTAAQRQALERMGFVTGLSE